MLGGSEDGEVSNEGPFVRSSVITNSGTTNAIILSEEYFEKYIVLRNGE